MHIHHYKARIYLVKGHKVKETSHSRLLLRKRLFRSYTVLLLTAPLWHSIRIEQEKSDDNHSWVIDGVDSKLGKYLIAPHVPDAC